MAASDEAIARLALDFIGNDTTITTLSTDTSVAATVLQRWLTNVRMEMFQAYPWGWARKEAVLAGEADDPNNDWAKSYTYPTDCAKPLYITSGNRVPSTISPPTAFAVGQNSGSTLKLIFTDEDDASLTYTKLVTDTTLYTEKFVTAFALLWATKAVTKLSKGDPYGMFPRLYQMYLQALDEAKAEDATTYQRDAPPLSEFEGGR